MRTAAEILAELRERGVSQAKMAEVLGIQQPNVNTLYKPAKNGKLRILGYDEAVTLMGAFGLDVPDAKAAEDGDTIPVPSEAEIATMIQRAMRELPVGVSFEDYPRAVSSSLHAQLKRFRVEGSDPDGAGANAPGKAAPLPKPTKRSSRAKSRNP